MSDDQIIELMKNPDCVIYVGDDATGYTCWRVRDKSVIADGPTEEEARANLIELEKFAKECYDEIEKESRA